MSVPSTPPPAVARPSDDAAIADRVAEMRRAGANHVCIQVIRPDDPDYEEARHVYNAMIDRYNDGKPDESIAIVALLHDLCKAQFYKLGSRNVKNETTGAWEKVPFYTIDDKFPFGHGEKSVFLIERFMRLKVEEAIAIRWHMGGFDDAARGGSFAINGAFERYPLAVKLHISDIEATYLMENTPH
mgnify:CR=1 FL=1